MNDGSTDGSGDICERYRSENPAIIEVRHQDNAGAAASRLALMKLAAATSEYIVWADADDLQSPYRLKYQARYLDDHPDILGVGAWGRIFGDKSQFGYRPCGSNVIRVVACFGSPVFFPSFTMRSSVHSQYGVAFDPAIPAAEDYDFINKVIAVGDLANIPVITTAYRRHAAQQSTADIVRQFARHLEVSRQTIERQLDWEPSEEETEILVAPAVHKYGEARVFSLCEEFARRSEEAGSLDMTAVRRVLSYRLRSYNRNNIRVLLAARKQPWFSFSSIAGYVLNGTDPKYLLRGLRGPGFSF